MTINYALFETSLASCETGTYVAVVQSKETAQMEDVIDRMVQQGSTVTRADIMGVLEDYCSVVERMLLEGKRVNTPIANFGSSVRGLFDSPVDEFDGSRHQVMATVSPGRRLRATMQHRSKLARRELPRPVPNLETFIDVNTGEENATLTPGGIGHLVGHRLKIADPDDAAQGIFLVGETGDQVRVSVIGHNKPRQLMFLIPAGLPAGQYRLVVRSSFDEDEHDVREGGLRATLTVS